MTNESLPPRTVVVTGSAQGIGLAVATEFAVRGDCVVIADRSADAATHAADHLTAAGRRAVPYEVDVTESSSVEEMFDLIEHQYGAIDVVVNNAGININSGIRKLSDVTWDTTLAVNLTGVMNCSRAASRRMVPRKTGRIVNIASRAWLGWFGQSAYASSKGGVVSLTRSIAIELARHGITVNAIAPGLIDTPLLRSEPPEVMAKLMQAQPTGTLGDPAVVGLAVAHLASPAARSLTGQVLYVCGGKSLFAKPA